MAKELKFTLDGMDYRLTFTRKTVQMMEQNGFRIENVAAMPMTYLPQLFRGAFLANHRFTKTEKIDEMFEHMTNKSELINRLTEMYNDTLITLLNDPEEDDSGKIQWATDW